MENQNEKLGQEPAFNHQSCLEVQGLDYALLPPYSRAPVICCAFYSGSKNNLL